MVNTMIIVCAQMQDNKTGEKFSVKMAFDEYKMGTRSIRLKVHHALSEAESRYDATSREITFSVLSSSMFTIGGYVPFIHKNIEYVFG